MKTKQELINSQEFETALTEGAECKKEILTTYKKDNKENFNAFCSIMYGVNEEVKNILNKKKKQQTESEKELLKSFKKELKDMYSQTQALTIKEKLEDGQKTRIEKIVDKIIPVIEILSYIDNTALSDEFKKRGFELTSNFSLEDKYPELKTEEKKASIKSLFTAATNIRQKVVDKDEYIVSDLFTSKVPADLQFDKNVNNAGIKSTDFKKLVDLKTKLILAESDEDKEKANEKVEQAAEEKQFEAARAELIRDKMSNL